MKRSFLTTAMFIVLLLTSGAQMLSAQLKLSSLFTDNMVLQRDTSVSVWGWGIPGEKVCVTASWNEKSFSTVVSEDGTWSLKVVTDDAGGPYEINVHSKDEHIRITELMLGEVWICSGQSNMVMKMTGYTGQPVENALQYVLESPGYAESVRIFNIKRDSSHVAKHECEAVWEKASPSSTASASALGYIFATRLADALNVPIGIIMTTYGGTRIESWTPKHELIAALDGVIPDEDIEKKLAKRNFGNKRPDQVGTLFNSMINPIVPFTAKGFIWYQGCSNVRTNDHSHYAQMQAAMIKGWRTAWNDTSAEMPFYFVTLAPYSYDNSNGLERPLLVESQLKSLEMIPNSHAAITEIYGEEHCIHPKRKSQIADQLAWNVLANEYGFSGLPSGYPYYDRIEIKGDKIIVYFSNAKHGLCPSYGEEIKGFTIAGPDKKFYPAKARITWKPYGIEVSSDKVKNPVAVRYSFLNYTESNLSNIIGIPVPPFRTDNW